MADTLKNPNTPAYDIGLDSIESTIRQANTAKKATINELGQTETALVNERDKAKYDRIDQQKERLDNIESTFNQNTATRREDLDKIRQRQEAIASRNANMSVAQAGAGWVLLSEWEKQSINEDVQAKYGENILSADQQRNQANTALDQAVKGTALEVYAKRSDINGLLASLDDAGKAALIDAARKAQAGDAAAEDQVANALLQYKNKQTDESYTRFAVTERQMAEENTFRNAAPEIKLAMVTANVWQIPGAEFANKNIADLFEAEPNISFEAATNKIKWQAAMANLSAEALKAAIAAGNYSPKDSSFLRDLLNKKTSALWGSDLRNDLPTGSAANTYGNKNQEVQNIANKTQKTGIKIPTVQEIDMVKSKLEASFKAGRLPQKDYNRYLLWVNKIAQNGMDVAQYANTYGNSEWLKRLEKAK